MRVLISGSTGLVGAAVAETLRKQGHDAVPLIRPAMERGARDSSDQEKGVAWDPVAGMLGPGADGADAVVHLAGASIAEGRWNAKRKLLLRDSRVAATRHLVSALGRLRRPPSTFIAASAIGFYGDRGDEVLSESSPPGGNFLAKLCLDWEAESNRAQQIPARVVILRFGVVLANNGGALPQIAMPFRFGAGGRIGSGRQWISWITLRDVAEIVRLAATNQLIGGPVNVVAPHPARNAEFAAALGHVLHRPAIFPTPAVALRLALGEMADALLLGSQRVVPEKLQQIGYSFVDPDLPSALESILGRAA
jgi:uncharacterized protein (TIGR01777 family)